MANETKVIIEFIGDPSGMKPAMDAMRALGTLTKEQEIAFAKANAEFQKRVADMAKATSATDALKSSTDKAGQSAKGLSDKTKDVPKHLSDAGKAAGKVDSQMQTLLSSAKKLAGALGIAFGIGQVKDFLTEASKMAGVAQGVKAAFDRIGSVQLLEDMRKAVKGTVSDVNLMKNAVRANNFQIPLEQLATLFEFARRRAKETGESVDYLVDSIILGIGRKSPLILDNLGISAVKLRQKLSGVSAETAEIGDIAKIVGDIATEEMSKMGAEIETVDDKTQRLTASTDNLTVAIGNMVNVAAAPAIGFFTTLADAITATLSAVETYQTKLGEMSGLGLLRELQMQKSKLVDLETELSDVIGKQSEAQTRIDMKRIKLQNELIAAVESELEKKVAFASADDMTIENIDKQIAAYKKLQEEMLQPVIVSIHSLNAEIKDLKDGLEGAALGSGKFYRIADAITKKSEQLTKVLDELKFRSEFIDAKGRFKFAPIEIKTPANDGRFGDFGEFKFNVDTGELESLTESLTGLNELLSEATEKMNAAGEFTDGFNKWAARVDDLQSKIDDFSDRVIKKNDEIKLSTEDVAKSTSENWEISISEAIRGFGKLFSTISQISAQNIQYEQEVLQTSLEKNEITREQYEQRRKQLAREQAKNTRDQALFAAIVNTAAAIAEALPNIPLSLLAGALGLAEIAVISSKPLPQFAVGTKNAPAGFKWVGEKGAELIYDGGGYPIITAAESSALSNDPHSESANRIRAKYDIPRLDIGMFKTPSMTIDPAAIKNIPSRSLINYEQLAKSIANEMMFNDRNIVTAIDRDRSTTAAGLHAVIKTLQTQRNHRATW